MLRTFALSLATLCAPALAAKDASGCGGFHWDVAAELAALRAPAQAIEANTHLQAAAMPLEVGVHYRVTLFPEGHVAYIVPPQREARDPSPMGGILYFDVRESGRYRFAFDTRHWIDVLVPGPNILASEGAQYMPAVGHDGAACDDLHKVVAFDLEAGTTYRVHLSGSAAAHVNLVVTRGAASDSAKE